MSMSISAFAGARTQPKAPAPVSPTAVDRRVYDAQGREVDLERRDLGVLSRSEGQAPAKDAAVNTAYDNAGIVHDFYARVLGRDAIDGKGSPITSIVHYGQNYGNAFWDGEEMVYGDGDGEILGPLVDGLDVVGHEMTHGVTEHTAGLRYKGQSGALNESWSDVMGELIEQWHKHPSTFGRASTAKAQDWLIGEDVWTPGTAGDALRSMKAPGTAFKHVYVGDGQYIDDDQPANMKDYVTTTRDNGGVHTNSGIPNKAAYEVGIRVGGTTLAKIWYETLTRYLTPSSDFQAAADATLAVATQRFGTKVEQAVRDAWTSVGIVPKDGAVPATAAQRGPSLRAGQDVNHGFVPDYIISAIQHS